MIAMIHIPRVRLSLVLAALAILLVVPMAGARSLGGPSMPSADAGWIGAALSWVSGLNLRANHHGHSGKPARNTKDDTSTQRPAGGGCIGPDGRPKPLCI
jgi:hypothetical protein